MIKRYLPSFIVKGNILKDIFESQQAEVDLLNNNIQDLIDNLFVETATWSLENWEKKYNIPIDRVIRHYDASRKSCPGLVGWNDGTLYKEDGSKTKEKNNSNEWIKFKKKLG